MVWDLNLERVARNVRAATTEDLLDRATAYRSGMEPAALELIDAELRARGVGPEQVEAHARARQTVTGPDGLALKCCHCRQPAATVEWRWYWLGGLVPLFPRRAAYCEKHRPGPRLPPAVPEPPGGSNQIQTGGGPVSPSAG
jgi:hypothetical protein